MSRNYLCGTPLPLEQEVEIGGVTINQIVGSVRCIEAISNSDSVKRIFLIEYDGISETAWRWSGDVEKFDEDTVSLDPDVETQWEAV